jgi:murein DD-endopeptidase MepM/ murein hydrolase activator NlpD
MQDRRSKRSPIHWRWLRLLLAVAVLMPIVSTRADVAPVRADDLTDAVAQQQALDKLIAQQKKQLSGISDQQTSLQGQMTTTAQSLDQVSQNVDVLQSQMDDLKTQVGQVQEEYNGLLATETDLQAQLDDLQARADAKQAQLLDRQQTLAARIVAAYQTDQTPLLAQLVTSHSITDVLSDVSYYMDLGAQDKALAEQIVQDQKSLAEMEQQVKTARESTDALAMQVAAQKAELDGQLSQLASSTTKLSSLERQLNAQLAQQQAADAKLAKNKVELAATIKANGEASDQLSHKIDQLAAQVRGKDRIPSVYNGTFEWPMGGKVSQEFGCTGWFSEPRVGDCAHFHQGIDIVAPCLTPVHAAGSGVIIFAGYNPYDPPPRAWLVIIAHSSHLVTWYAHMTGQNPPGIYVGAQVSAGQLIGTENTTGHSTGCHLHWAVIVDGVFKNPRLFI